MRLGKDLCELSKLKPKEVSDKFEMLGEKSADAEKKLKE